MTPHRGPHYSQKCAFHINPDHPLSAEKSVHQCVECVTHNHPRLQAKKADLHQVAYLTILENSPKYNPNHHSGASLNTFVRSRVCTTLWNEDQKDLKSIPYSALEEDNGPQQQKINRLIDRLQAESMLNENVEDTVAWEIDLEKFKSVLPQLLMCLKDKERQVVELKFYQGLKAVEIAKRIGVSEGRVSQLHRSAIAKLTKAYLFGITQS